MYDPLENTRLKLARACKHLNELDRKFNNFVERKPYSILQYVDVEKSCNIYRGKFRNPPKGWGTVIGDIVHNLRSSLDCITFAFCQTPTNRTEFPTFEKKPFNSKTRREYRDRVEGIPEDVKAVIESFQPYHAGESLSHLHPLAMLNQLSIIDKHRTRLHPWPYFFVDGGKLPNGAVTYLDDGILQIELPFDIDAELNFKEKFSAFILIGFPHVPWGFHHWELRRVHEYISNEIIPCFASFEPPLFRPE